MRRDRPSNPCCRTRSMMNKIALLGAVNQAFVLQSRDRALETAPSGQVMLVSDRRYCIHQPETAIALIVAEEGRRVQADNAKIADNCDRTGEAAWQRLKLN